MGENIIGTWRRLNTNNFPTVLPDYRKRKKKKIHYTLVGKLTQNPAVSQKEPTQRAESPHMDTLIL